jgi:hypothetical protein
MKRAWVTFLATGLAVAAMACGTVLAQATAQISGAVKDQSGAVLPGVEVTVTQTNTQIARMTVSNETGAYALPNLPIGSYRLEASLPGFRKFVQTGIVLEVNGNPTLNVVMEVGQVSEQVEVQANASLVETRQVGVGEVMENARILDLPLNGRNVADLVALSGTATPSPILNGNGGRDPFSAGNFSIAGGLNSGLNYTLDGASHINAFDNSYLTMPFPDALQEFKVETSATGAQTNGKSAGSISLVTKSGTNNFHGDVFEFVRNGKFNARNAFSPTRDTIKRNQFGGTIGGPIIANKLFFFGGYQGTLFRQDPADQIAFVPTAAELAGDFTALASPACNGGRAIPLKAPFVNNRVDPKLFSPPALALTSKLPQSTDPCGRVTFGDPVPQNDHVGIGRIDFQQSAKNTIFGRYLVDHNSVPPGFEINHSPLISGTPALGKVGLAQAFTIGDTVSDQLKRRECISLIGESRCHIEAGSRFQQGGPWPNRHRDPCIYVPTVSPELHHHRRLQYGIRRSWPDARGNIRCKRRSERASWEPSVGLWRPDEYLVCEHISRSLCGPTNEFQRTNDRTGLGGLPFGKCVQFRHGYVQRTVRPRPVPRVVCRGYMESEAAPDSQLWPPLGTLPSRCSSGSQFRTFRYERIQRRYQEQPIQEHAAGLVLRR